MLVSSSIKREFTWKCVKVEEINEQSQGINDFEFSYVRVMVCLSWKTCKWEQAFACHGIIYFVNEVRFHGNYW